MSDFKIFKGDRTELNRMFKKDNIILVYIILVAIVIGFLISALFMFYSNLQNSDVIQSGIYIKGVNVSGLTRNEAITLVTNEIKGQMNDHIVLRYKNNYEFYVDIEQIEAEFDVESSVDFALKVAKSGNMFEDLETYISVLMVNIDIDPILTYSEEALTKYLENIESNLPDQLEQSSYYLDDDTLVITNGVNGAGIYMDEMKQEILAAIQDISYSNSYIELLTYVEYPDEINVDAIHNEVYRAVENAYFTTEPYAVFAEVEGVDFNVEATKTAISENPDAEEYVIDLEYTEPEVTVNDLGMEAFPDLLATYSTKYATSNTDRTTNLKLASAKINGTVVMPGETFSYNKVVGKRTIAAGYKEAAIYENGQVTSGLGGGICQISTTLYNAVVGADMEITSRRNHMFVPSYVSAGQDATVVWGSTDFKFTNNRDYPIKIESSVSGGIATVNIYGLKTENDVYSSITIESTTVKSTSTTLVVDAYKVYRQNGAVVKKEKLSRDTYSVSSH